MHRSATAIAAAALLASCAPTPVADVVAPFPPTDLPFFGGGYKGPDDDCRRLGEGPATAEFLDDAADLVGCLEDGPSGPDLVATTGARAVARQDGYVLYSVPRH